MSPRSEGAEISVQEDAGSRAGAARPGVCGRPPWRSGRVEVRKGGGRNEPE